MVKKTGILTALLMFVLLVAGTVEAGSRTPLRVAQYPLLIQSRMLPSQAVQDDLGRLIDRSLHVPLNGTLQAVEYIPERECLAAMEEVKAEAKGKYKLKDLMRPLAEKLQADLVVVPILTGYEQYQTMSWHRWGHYIVHSYAAVQITGYDKSKDEVFNKGASRQFNDEYSTQGDVSTMAHEVMDEALRSAKVHERVWIWRDRFKE